MAVQCARARKLQIAVVGKETMDSQNALHRLALEMASEVGRLLVQRGAIVLTGGLGGVMAAASQGAADGGGIDIGILPLIEPEESSRRHPNESQAVCIRTGLDPFARVPILILSSDAVIVVSGGDGALAEAELAISCGIPVVTLPETGGTAASLAASSAERVIVAASAIEAVELALRAIPAYRPDFAAPCRAALLTEESTKVTNPVIDTA